MFSSKLSSSSPGNGHKQALSKCFVSRAYSEFFQGEGTKFRHFFKLSFFPGRVNFKQLK